MENEMDSGLVERRMGTLLVQPWYNGISSRSQSAMGPCSHLFCRHPKP